MDKAVSLIEDTKQRMRAQKTVNRIAFLALNGIALLFGNYALASGFSLPPWVTLTLLAMALTPFFLRVARESRSDITKSVATLIDEKVTGRERFLTIATAKSPPIQGARQAEIQTQLRRQAAQKATFFVPQHELPFKIERRVSLSMGAAVSGFLLFLYAPASKSPQQTSHANPSLVATKAEPSSAPNRQEFTPGVEPRLGPRVSGPQQSIKFRAAEQQKPVSMEIQEAKTPVKQDRSLLNWDIPLPQIFPIDLNFFRTEDQTGQSERNPQTDFERQEKGAEDLNQGREVSEATSASMSRGESPEKDGATSKGQATKINEKKEKTGGGITFDQALPAGGKKDVERAGAKNAAPSNGLADGRQQNSVGPGAAQGNHNRTAALPGRNLSSQNTGGSTLPNTGSRNNYQSGPEQELNRFYKKGEGAVGFLIKDLGYVTVRIPLDETDPHSSEDLLPNEDSAVPITPYSNAPLKDDPSVESVIRQRVPLEYQDILR